MEYCVATKTDKEELIEFLNKVFTKSEDRKVDFKKLVYKVYGDEVEFTQRHHLVKEEGRIVAAIGVYQREYCIGNSVLNTGFIGSVSVDPDMRGKGYMKLLMQKAEEDMRSKGIGLAMLSGSRNRYGYFGYEVGGLRYEFCFSRGNITHTIGWTVEKPLELIPVLDKDMVGEEIYRLYENTKVHSCNREEFFDRALTWNGRLYTVKKDDKYLGYVILSENGESISEIELNDWNCLLEVVREVMLFGNKERISVCSLVWENEKNEAMQSRCESYSIHPACSYKVLDYMQTLKALFELQLLYKSYLVQDVFTIAIKEQGCYRIEIKDNVVSIKDGGTDEKDYAGADIVVEGRDFVNAFMSPMCGMYESRSKKAYPGGWFPLGFAPAVADGF